MTTKKVKELNSGIYIIFWKAGGQSTAAIGITRDGFRWMAPLNWVYPSDKKKCWREVKKVIKV